MDNGYYHIKIYGHPVWVVNFNGTLYMPSMWVRILALVSIQNSKIPNQISVGKFIKAGLKSLSANDFGTNMGKVLVCPYITALQYIKNARASKPFDRKEFDDKIRIVYQNAKHLLIGSKFEGVKLVLPDFLVEPVAPNAPNNKRKRENDEEEMPPAKRIFIAPAPIVPRPMMQPAVIPRTSQLMLLVALMQEEQKQATKRQEMFQTIVNMSK